MKQVDADEQATARMIDSGFNGVPAGHGRVNVELRKCLRTMEVRRRKQIFGAIMTLKAEMLEKPVGDRWQHVEAIKIRSPIYQKECSRLRERNGA